MENWAASPGVQQPQSQESNYGARASYVSRYGTTQQPKAANQVQLTTANAAGDYQPQHVAAYVPFRWQYGSTPSDPARNYTAYINCVRPRSNSTLNNFSSETNSTLDAQPYHSGPIYLTEQRFTDKPKSGYETSEKGLPQRPLSSIAFGDVRGQRVQLQNALIVPAAISFEQSHPQFHKKPCVYNHIPERPVDVEVLRRTPRNPFLKQEPKYLKNSLDAPPTYAKQHEFNNLMKQAVSMYHQLQQQYNTGQHGPCGVHTSHNNGDGGQQTSSSCQNHNHHNPAPHQGYHQNHYPSCPNFPKFEQFWNQQLQRHQTSQNQQGQQNLQLSCNYNPHGQCCYGHACCHEMHCSGSGQVHCDNQQKCCNVTLQHSRRETNKEQIASCSTESNKPEKCNTNESNCVREFDDSLEVKSEQEEEENIYDEITDDGHQSSFWEEENRSGDYDSLNESFEREQYDARSRDIYQKKSLEKERDKNSVYQRGDERDAMKLEREVVKTAMYTSGSFHSPQFDGKGDENAEKDVQSEVVQDKTPTKESLIQRTKYKVTRPTKASFAKERELVSKPRSTESKSRKLSYSHPASTIYPNPNQRVDNSNGSGRLKPALKHPKNLKPPNRKFMEPNLERSSSLGRYNRYFSDPTFDPAERFKRAQQRIDNLQRQVNSLERPFAMKFGIKTRSASKASKDEGQMRSRGDEKSNNEFTTSGSVTNPADVTEDDDVPVKSIFSLMYDTDGKPLNQEAKQVQRMIEDEYEQYKQLNPIPATSSKRPTKSAD